MHAGSIYTSDRLKQTLSILRDGGWHGTWDIMQATHSCAVHSDVAAIRQGGLAVETRCVRANGRTRNYEYRLVAGGQMEMGL